MIRYLEDHPDAELQLTGGLDSRILLAAIPPSMRRNSRVMTLTVPDSEDSSHCSRTRCPIRNGAQYDKLSTQ